jgi:CPA2 family monovalent cation:H+ antiporter-2
LKERQLLYVILEHDIKLVDKAIESGEESIFLANAGQKGVLDHFCIRKSLAVVVTISNEHQMRLICENINSFDVNINSIIKVRNQSEADTIKDLNIRHVINSREMVSNILVEKIVECELPI